MLHESTWCHVDEWNLGLPWEQKYPSCYYKKGHSVCSREASYILLILYGEKKCPKGNTVFKKKKNFDQIYKISFQCWSNQVNPLFKCLLDFIGSELLRPSLFPPSPVPPVSAERLLWFYCLCLHFRFALWFHCAAIQEGGTGAVCSKMLVTKPLSLTLSNFSHHGPA